MPVARFGDILGDGGPVLLVRQPELFGFAPCDLRVDPVGGDAPDVPECSGAGAVGVEEIKRAGFIGGNFKSKSGDVFAIDRTGSYRQSDVSQAPLRLRPQ